MRVNKIDSFRGEYFFLSNFSISPIYLDNRKYETVEHFYQAGKADNAPVHDYIRNAPTPGEAKKRGSQVRLRENWKNIKLQYMKLGLILKFDINDLGDKLLATGDTYLEEGNNWEDTFWGVCNNIGKNNLGKLLMEVRDEVLFRRSKQTSTLEYI